MVLNGISYHIILGYDILPLGGRCRGRLRREEGGRAQGSGQTTYYTPELPTMKFHWNMPLSIRREVPLEVHHDSEVSISGVQCYYS